MNTTSMYAGKASNSTFLTVLLLMLVVFVAHFLYFKKYGLYEDDYFFISTSWRLPAFIDQIKAALLEWPQGRPVGFLIPPVLSFLGEKIGGLAAIYAMGFLVVSLNACLFYFLLRKVYSETIAVLGSLAFCLFPADTTHILLTHSLCLQIALTFWLVGAHLYLSGRRVLPYIAITASILTYESPYMVFLVLPLLRNKWDRAMTKDLIRHAGVMAGIVICMIVLRALMGEERVNGMAGDLPAILIKVVKGIAIGPMASMLQFINAPIRVLYNWNLQLTILAAAPLVAIVWMLSRSVDRQLSGNGNVSFDTQKLLGAQGKPIVTGESHLVMWQLYVSAVLMLCLAYLLSFTHFPPVASYGRVTSVHLAAALGGSLLFAGIGSQLIAFASRFHLRSVAIMLLSIYLSVIVGYRLMIQVDFKRAWDYQRTFWTNVLQEVPDIKDGTVIFVVEKDLPKTLFIYTNSWADPIILGELFDFPANWQNPPRLFVVKSEWYKALSRSGNQLVWTVPVATWESHVEVVPDSNLILLKMEDGKLVRKYGSINIDGLELNLKSRPPGSGLDYGRGPLFKYLIQGG